MKNRGLSQEGLKLAACMTMLLDHLGAVLLLDIIAEAQTLELARMMTGLYYFLRCVGRLAFPLYAFLLAEGVRHTRNPMGYGIRLVIGAVLTELPYDLLFYGGVNLQHCNAMVTLLLGFGYAMAARMVKTPWLRMGLVLPFLGMAELLGASYGAEGVGIITLFLLTEGLPRKRLVQTLGLAFFCWLIGGISVDLLGISVPVQMFGVLSMVPIALYSGEKRMKSRWVQWIFYLFYPVHLGVLWLWTML